MHSWMMSVPKQPTLKLKSEFMRNAELLRDGANMFFLAHEQICCEDLFLSHNSALIETNMFLSHSSYVETFVLDPLHGQMGGLHFAIQGM